MAEFDATTVLSAPSGTEIVGAAQHADTDLVVVSVNGTGVYCQSIPEQKTMSSFSFPPQRHFQAPAVLDPTTRHFYAAIEKPAEICCWQESLETFSKRWSMELPLKGPAVRQLLTLKTLRGTVVVFEDGSWRHVQCVDGQLQLKHSFPRPHLPTKKCTVHRSFLVKQPKSPPQVMLIMKSPNGKQAYCCCATLPSAATDSSTAWSVCAVAVPEQAAAATVLDVCCGSSLLLYSFWSCGSIVQHQLEYTAEGKLDVSSSLVQQVKCCTTTVPALLSPLLKDSAALVGQHPVTGETRLYQWDMAFGVLHYDFSVHNETAQLLQTVRISKSCVLVVTSQSVSAVHLEAVESSLAAVLGTSTKTDSNLAQPRLHDAVLYAPVILSYAQYAGGHADACKKHAAINQAVQAVLDESQTATLDALQTALKTLLDLCTPTGSHSNQRRLPQPCIAPVLRRLIKETRYDAAEAVLLVLRQQCVSASDCPGLLEYGLQRSANRQMFLVTTLRSVLDLSEEELVRVLKQLISETPGEMSEVATTVLRTAMTLAWDESRVVAALRALGVDETKLILTDVLFWLHTHNHENVTSKTVSGPRPTHAQVFDWLGYVLDAQMSTLVLARDTHELVVKAQHELQQFRDVCDELAGLQGLIEHIANNKKLPHVHRPVGPYSVELLDV
eukprot:m.104331 g.104331  ORF g.104331 m.104331 type:complete len:669 (+) comp18882_c0_seq1:2769-4775(+)